MPRLNMHKLAGVSARAERSGIAIHIAGEQTLILSQDVARRLAAVLAVALVDARSVRPHGSREPANG